MKIILASKSPRRAALLDLIKIDFEVMPSSFKEVINNKLDIEEASKELAYQKAFDVFNNISQGPKNANFYLIYKISTLEDSNIDDSLLMSIYYNIDEEKIILD